MATHPIPSPNTGELVRQLRSVSKWCCIFQHEGQSRHGMSNAPFESATLIEHLEHEKAELLRQLEVAREESEFVWKWVERGMFCKHTQPYDALETMAYFPLAPWQNGRWDVDHKPYAAEFYKRFPKALSNISGQG